MATQSEDSVSQFNVGVVRLYRSSAGRPFTNSDARLIQLLCTTDRCSRLFENWSKNLGNPFKTKLDPDIPIPPSRSIYSELQTTVNKLNALGQDVKRGHVFVLRGDHFEEFACYPSHELPPQTTRFKPNTDRDEGLCPHAIVDSTLLAWARLLAWSGEDLMKTYLVFDVESEDAGITILADKEKLVQRTLMRIAARLTLNTFYPTTEEQTSERITKRFEEFVEEEIDIPTGKMFSNAKCVLLPVGSRRMPTNLTDGFANCPDRELDAYEVKIALDGGGCQIPLRTGTKITGVLLCRFYPNFANRINRALEDRSKFERLELHHSTEENHESCWYQLKHSVGVVVGGWARIVAPILFEKVNGS